MNPRGHPTKLCVLPRWSSDVWKNLTSPSLPPPSGSPQDEGKQLDHGILVKELEGGPERPDPGTGLGGEFGPGARCFPALFPSPPPKPVVQVGKCGTRPQRFLIWFFRP